MLALFIEVIDVVLVSGVTVLEFISLSLGLEAGSLQNHWIFIQLEVTLPVSYV